MEHRWSRRRFLGGEITLSHPRHGLVRALLRDISLGGMFVETGPLEVVVNTPVVVSFELPQGVGETSYHRLHAVIVRTAEDGAALMYLDSSADALQPLRQALYGPAAPVGEVWPETGPSAAAGGISGRMH